MITEMTVADVLSCTDYGFDEWLACFRDARSLRGGYAWRLAFTVKLVEHLRNNFLCVLAPKCKVRLCRIVHRGLDQMGVLFLFELLGPELSKDLMDELMQEGDVDDRFPDFYTRALEPLRSRIIKDQQAWQRFATQAR